MASIEDLIRDIEDEIDKGLRDANEAGSREGAASDDEILLAALATGRYGLIPPEHTGAAVILHGWLERAGVDLAALGRGEAQTVTFNLGEGEAIEGAPAPQFTGGEQLTRSVSSVSDFMAVALDIDTRENPTLGALQDPGVTRFFDAVSSAEASVGGTVFADPEAALLPQVSDSDLGYWQDLKTKITSGDPALEGAVIKTLRPNAELPGLPELSTAAEREAHGNRLRGFDEGIQPVYEEGPIKGPPTAADLPGATFEGAGGSLVDGKPSAELSAAQAKLAALQKAAGIKSSDMTSMDEDLRMVQEGFAGRRHENEAVADAIAAVQADIDAMTQTTTGGGGGSGGAPRLSAAEQTEADRSEIHAMLAEQFGGFAFFLNENNAALNVGVTADGEIVSADDPNAISTSSILDVIVEKGIVAPTRILGVLQKTEWFKTTDAQMRSFDAQFGELSEPGKVEYLEPVLNLLDDEAQFLGLTFDPGRRRGFAETIARQGKSGDIDFIRGLILDEQSYDNTASELSGFGAARDEIQALARQYYVPIGDDDAGEFAEQVYLGEKTPEQMTQYFKMQATNRFPTLAAAIAGGSTPAEYFAPYKYEIERMLDRPNVDMLEEYSDIIEYVPDSGGDARPMTLGETRTFIRGTDEWQASSQGQDQAQALAFAIGRSFGEDA